MDDLSFATSSLVLASTRGEEKESRLKVWEGELERVTGAKDNALALRPDEDSDAEDEHRIDVYFR